MKSAGAHQPRKRLGQHFLHERGVIERIVSSVDPRPEQTLVEIGPGLGALTEPLLAQTGHLHVVERDRELAAHLAERFGGGFGDGGTLRIHEHDALRFDFAALAPPRRRLRIVGNLPYNISTPLLFHLLEQRAAIEDMHFMLQREIVDRLTAAPGTSDYGRLTVMVQYACRTQRLFTVGPGAFTPAPRVTSAFVRLVVHRRPPVELTDWETFRALVARCFSQRRKTLRSILRGTLSEADIREAGADPGARPETLALPRFAALANRAANRAHACGGRP